MDRELSDALSNMEFCGPYFVKHATIYRWTDREHSQTHALEELLRFSENVAANAKIIRKYLEKKNA
jgi:hypothetical protein